MKKFVFITLFLLFYSNIVLAWEQVSVPDHVSNETSSPWNFFEDFENQTVGSIKLCGFSGQKKCLRNLSINDKGRGKDPFKIVRENDGNQFLQITVKHGWNLDPFKKKGQETERSEIQTKQKRTIGKIVWVGFRMRLPSDFQHIDDRVLFFQYKNQHDPMKKSPLLGLAFYENGKRLDIGGMTGGNADKSFNEKEHKHYGIRIKYRKSSIGKWFVSKEKDTNSNYRSRNFELTENESFEITKLGQWSQYKIGIHNSKNEDGFVKVYKDDQLIFSYNGVTYDWNGNYTGSYVRIGLYRDSGMQNDVEYPNQIIHFDNFTVVSDKRSLDDLMVD